LAADAEGVGDFGDGPAVALMPTQHLVLHLHPIAAVEELMPDEGGILDGVGARVEGAGRAEGGDLGIFGSGRASPGHDVNHNTSIIPVFVKGMSGRYLCPSDENMSRRPQHTLVDGEKAWTK
jgi:hypothetical protein